MASCYLYQIYCCSNTMWRPRSYQPVLIESFKMGGGGGGQKILPVINDRSVIAAGTHLKPVKCAHLCFIF